MFHLLWGFLFVGNFCRSGIFVGVFWGFWRGNFWGFLGFLAVGGFWGFCRFGGFEGGIDVVTLMLGHQCCNIENIT